MGKYITDAEAHLTLIYIVVMLAILGVGVWRHGKEAILHVIPAFLAGLLGVLTFASKLTKAVTAGTTTALPAADHATTAGVIPQEVTLIVLVLLILVTLVAVAVTVKEKK